MPAFLRLSEVQFFLIGFAVAAAGMVAFLPVAGAGFVR